MEPLCRTRLVITTYHLPIAGLTTIPSCLLIVLIVIVIHIIFISYMWIWYCFLYLRLVALCTFCQLFLAIYHRRRSVEGHQQYYQKSWCQQKLFPLKYHLSWTKLRNHNTHTESESTALIFWTPYPHISCLSSMHFFALSSLANIMNWKAIEELISRKTLKNVECKYFNDFFDSNNLNRVISSINALHVGY